MKWNTKLKMLPDVATTGAFVDPSTRKEECGMKEREMKGLGERGRLMFRRHVRIIFVISWPFPAAIAAGFLSLWLKALYVTTAVLYWSRKKFQTYQDLNSTEMTCNGSWDWLYENPLNPSVGERAYRKWMNWWGLFLEMWFSCHCMVPGGALHESIIFGTI